MSIQEALEHIVKAHDILTKLNTKEQQINATQPIMYTVIYEQLFDDNTWGPSLQHIQARTTQELFASMGHVVQEMGLTIRNMCYGTYLEMEEQEQRIGDYWREYYQRMKHE